MPLLEHNVSRHTGRQKESLEGAEERKGWFRPDLLPVWTVN